MGIIFKEGVPHPVKFRAIVTVPINDQEYGYYLTGPVFTRADEAHDYSSAASPMEVPMHRRGRIAVLGSAGPTPYRWRDALRYAEETGCTDPAAKVVVCAQTEQEARDHFALQQSGAVLETIWCGNPTTRREYVL